jgi:hypothetical protein
MPLYSYGLLTIDDGVPRVELKFYRSRA